MTDAAIDALIAQREAIEKQIAAAVLPVLTAAKADLAAEAVTTLVDTMKAHMEALPDGDAKQQLGNVVIVLENVPSFLDVEIARLTALTAEEAVPEA